MRKLTFVVALLATVPFTAFAGETASAPGTVQYFVNLQDGDTVQSPGFPVWALLPQASMSKTPVIIIC